MEPERVRGILGNMVTQEDHDFTTRCMERAWRDICAFYGPDGVKELRSVMSMDTVRRFTAEVLNAVEEDGMQIVPRIVAKGDESARAEVETGG